MQNDWHISDALWKLSGIYQNLITGQWIKCFGDELSEVIWFERTETVQSCRSAAAEDGQCHI